MQPGDVYVTYADVNDLVKDFNYQPNTTLQKGIGTFIDWYKAYYKVGDLAVIAVHLKGN